MEKFRLKSLLIGILLGICSTIVPIAYSQKSIHNINLQGTYIPDTKIYDHVLIWHDGADVVVLSKKVFDTWMSDWMQSPPCKK